MFSKARSRSFERAANRFRSRSLEAAAFGVAASAVPKGAAAAIISDVVVNQSPNATFELVVGDSTTQIDLISMTGGMGLDLALEGPTMGANNSTVEFANEGAPGMGGNPNFLSLLFAGDTVDSSLRFNPRALLVRQDTVNPDWEFVTDGYAGFVFDNGTGPLYGWMRLSFNGVDDFTVLQWAYDDTGAFIGVGVVPEPSTAILLGLGLAGIAAVRWRTRRHPAHDPG